MQGRIRKPIQSRVTKPQASERTFNTPPLDCETLISTYRKSQRRLFMFDYDGTLTNIVHDPDTALSRDPVISDLNVLAADDRNEVWIVSGRPESFLEEHLGHISALGLSAEHGCFIREPYHSNWVTLTEKLDLAWQEKVLEIFGKYTASGSHGTHIERKRIALTWHFRRADSRWSASAARACLLELQEKVEPFYEVDILKGKMNLEVRPRFVNKGEIARRLVESYQPDEPPDFVLCIGDDHTDEGQPTLYPRSTHTPPHPPHNFQSRFS